MKTKLSLLTVIALTGLAANTFAADYTHSTPAVQGYDVVSYQNAKRPIRGTGHYVAVHDGAVYQFANEDNLKAFNANPEKYVPAYNGYCAFGVSVGKKFIGDPEVYRVVDGRTYLNLDTSIQGDWLKDVPGRIETANGQWRSIKDKNPADL